MELSLELIRWLLNNTGVSAEQLGTLSTMGSGPFIEEDFDDLLTEIPLEPYQVGAETDVLVLGREGWSTHSLRGLLASRSGKNLRVYSQEMFILYLASGVDPLDDNEDQIRALSAEHPGLTFLESVGFDWPTTLIQPNSGGSLDVGGMQPISPLKVRGYSVGEKGLSLAGRRAVLADVYAGDRISVEIFTPEKVAKWGSANSSRRLYAMAEAIAGICSLAKRRARPPALAIVEWEEDLAWLKRTYYDGRYTFSWPSTEVW